MTGSYDDEDGVIIEQLPLGTRATIRDGELAGIACTIVEDDDSCYTVEIDILGAPVRLQVDYEKLAAGAGSPVDEERALEIASRFIESDVRSRSGIAASVWWANRAAERDWSDAELVDLAPPPVDEQVEIDRHIERMRADPSAPSTGAGHWIEAHLRAVHTSFVDRLDRAELGLSADADRAAVLARLEPGRNLRERVERARRVAEDARYGGDDLAGTRPIAEDPRLEAEIARDPAKPEPYAVYADWLQSRGDPRGELIALQSAGERSERAASQLLARHRRYFCGGLDLDGDEVVTGVEWRRGYIVRATVHTTRDHESRGRDLARTLRTFLALPSARFLEELSIGCASVHETSVEQAVVDAIVAAGPRPALRRLAFTTDGEEEMLSWTSTGNLAAIWSLVPELRELAVRAGTVELGRFSLSHLRVLEIETCGFAAANVEDLLASSLERLERLVLWFGSVERGAVSPLAAAAALLDHPIAVGLRELGFMNTEDTDALVEIVVRSPLFPRLVSLDLSLSTLTDDGAARLAEHLHEAKALRTLDVSECYLTPTGVSLLRRPGLEVTSTWQREPEEYEGRLHRYVGTVE